MKISVTPNFGAFLIVSAILAMGLLSLPGCSTLGANADQSKLIVQIATMKVIEADRDHAAERALKIREVASESKTFLDRQSVSVPMLADAINARLAELNLSPADRLLASALVDAVVNDLSARVDVGVLKPDQLLIVSQVLDWVIAATEFYAK